MACFQTNFRSFFRPHLLKEAYSSHLTENSCPLFGLPRWLSVKNSPANAGDAGDEGDAGDAVSIPGSGRLLEEEMATLSAILAWRFPWMEEPDRLQSVGLSSLPFSLNPFSCPAQSLNTSNRLCESRLVMSDSF